MFFKFIMFKTLNYCMAGSFWETACQPNPGWFPGWFRPHLLPWVAHNMRESDLDGDQDLTFWLRTLEDVLREILGDERMDSHQDFKFEMPRTEEGERQFGASN